MDINFFFRGIIIGLVIAMPVGPIGVLCIHRTLVGGKIHGLVSGLGAATADTLYGAVAALGLTFVSSFLIEQQFWFRLVGAVFLCGLGIRTIFLKTTQKTGAVSGGSLAVDYGSTLFLTLMNPVTLLAFAAVFASLGITGSCGGSAGLLMAGVFAGSCTWWILVSCTAGLFRQKVTGDNLLWLNRISGTLITTFGLLLLFNLKT